MPKIFNSKIHTLDILLCGFKIIYLKRMVTSLASAPAINKIRPDPVPSIRDAGKWIATGGHNADLCIRAELFPHEKPGNPGTPPHIAKYRKLAHIAPGQIQVHPGLQDDK